VSSRPAITKGASDSFADGDGRTIRLVAVIAAGFVGFLVDYERVFV
jgi:hypothetical protein